MVVIMVYMTVAGWLVVASCPVVCHASIFPNRQTFVKRILWPDVSKMCLIDV